MFHYESPKRDLLHKWKPNIIIAGLVFYGTGCLCVLLQELNFSNLKTFVRTFRYALLAKSRTTYMICLRHSDIMSTHVA